MSSISVCIVQVVDTSFVDDHRVQLLSSPQQISHSFFNVLLRSTKETCLALWDEPKDSAQEIYFIGSYISY